MKNFSLFSLSFLIALNTSGVALAQEAQTAIAKINDTTISKEEFERRYQENQKFFSLKQPTKREVLEDIIKRELAIQEAKKKGLHRDPEVLNRMETVLYHALLEKELGEQVKSKVISDAEAKAYYAKNPEIRTSHIVITLPANASKDDEAKTKAQIERIIREEIKPGKMSFAEAAQRYSEGPSARMGGDIDYKTRDQVGDEYYDAAIRLQKAGQMSGAVKTPLGYHIIKLTGIRSWDEVDRAAVKRHLHRQNELKLFENYMKKLQVKAKIQINDALLK